MKIIEGHYDPKHGKWHGADPLQLARLQLAAGAPPVPEWFYVEGGPLHVWGGREYDEVRMARWPWYYADLVLRSETALAK